MIIIGIFLVVVIVALQIGFFQTTRSEISKLNHFFPDQENLWLVYTTLSKSILRHREKLKEFVKTPPPEKNPRDMEEGDVNVALVKSKGGSDAFKLVIEETNEYLCKNAGTSADLEILQDICEKKLLTLDNSIKATLNAPLYLGLAGTFLGIIIGVLVFAHDLENVFGVVGGNAISTSDLSGLESLLTGIGIAMIASLCGLGFTVCNTVFNYKNAQKELDIKENDYFDFLRRELMPTLSNSMNASLNSLKSVLGHFVDKFGRNLDNYADSAKLLNENLEKQHIVLTQIQEIGVTKMAAVISSSFAELKEAADSLMIFRKYQKGLNDTMERVSFGIGQMDLLVGRFDEFIKALKIVASAQVENQNLNKEFKKAIEQHFPTGSEGREIWRKEFDNLMSDARKVSERFNEQLTVNTRYVNNFIKDNERFFRSFDEIRSVLVSLIEYAKIQGECYKDLKEELNDLRKDTLDTRKSNAELQKTLLQAIQAMTRAIKDKKI